jgi:hypothetical protein
MRIINDPQNAEKIGEATRAKLNIRRLAREHGWNINKLI